jgi:hypothetical protein
MDLKLACPACGQHIVVDASLGGGTVDCPGCNAAVPIPQLVGAQEAVVSVSPSPSPAALPPIVDQQEQVIFDEGGIVVTKTRFIADGQTFSMANITSISSAEIPAKTGGYTALILFGAILCLFVFASWWCLTVGIIMIAAGVTGFSLSNSEYAVVLFSAAQEMKTCVRRDRYFVFRVVEALNRAIVMRG